LGRRLAAARRPVGLPVASLTAADAAVASEISSGEEVWLVSHLSLSNKLILEFIPIFYDHQHLKHAKRV